MLTYQVESLEDVLEELKPLLSEHWEEVAWYKDKVKLNPDYDRYLELDKLRMLYVTTVRDEGVLVGYNVHFIMPHLHYSDDLYAINDIIFLHPDYRHYGTASELIEFAETSLLGIGVKVCTYHMKLAHPFHTLMEQSGYQAQEYVYSKYIGE